jgi:hypothetical protein
MTGSNEGAHASGWNHWRIARWAVVAALLLTPLAMMQVSEEWHWTTGDFLFAGVMIGGVALLYDVAERASGSRAYRAGVGVALVASLLSVWSSVVRDDGTGMGYFLVIMAVVVGAFSAWFRPAGMARTMFGVAIMQALLGIAVATAPSTASLPDGAFKALQFAGFFAVLWLVSGALFRAASKSYHGVAASEE